MAPTVFTAGGAASLSLQKNKKSPPASISSDTNDEASPDRAAGSAPSSPVKQVSSQENEKLNTAYSGDLSSSDDEVSYDESEDIEGQSELHGLLSHEDGQRQIDDLYNTQNNEHILNTNTTYDHDESLNSKGKLLWLAICFFGIMMSFVGYGLLLEYATSGGRKLHELSFLFVTSCLYTVTAAAGRHVRDEVPTTIPPARFAVLGITSMGSTFCSVRSLR